MVLIAGSTKGLFKNSDCGFTVRTVNMAVHGSLATVSHVGKGSEDARAGLTQGCDLTKQESQGKRRARKLRMKCLRIKTVAVELPLDKGRSEGRRGQGTVTFLGSFKLAPQNYFVKFIVKLAF